MVDELQVEVVGPSLRYATAMVTKATRSSSSNGDSISAATSGGYSDCGDEPPF